MTMQEQIRNGIKTAILSSGGGHAGGSLSAADIMASLYGTVMKFDPTNPGWSERDRFILSKGHSGLVLYSALAASGFFPPDELKTFGQNGSPFMNHPDAHRIPGVELSTGSLGHGIALAVGIALAGKMQNKDYFTYCLVGDGECCEGTVWEAAMAAGTWKLKRLCVIVDQNRIGNDGFLDEEMDLEPMAERWKSFGFKTVLADGHNVDSLNSIFLNQREECDGPYAVIAQTIKGYGLVDGIAGAGASHYLSGSPEKLAEKFAF